MSSIDRGRGSAPPGKQKEPLSSASEDPAEPYPDWLDRMRESFEDEERQPDPGAPRNASGNKPR